MKSSWINLIEKMALEEKNEYYKFISNSIDQEAKNIYEYGIKQKWENESIVDVRKIKVQLELFQKQNPNEFKPGNQIYVDFTRKGTVEIRPLNKANAQ